MSSPGKVVLYLIEIIHFIINLFRHSVDGRPI